MNYRRVGQFRESVVASASFQRDSSRLFKVLIDDRAVAEERLQEKREDKFFNRESITDVTVNDIKTDDLVISEEMLSEVDSINLGTWSNIVEDCYSYSDHRDPDHPLDRVSSVSKNINIPEMSEKSVRFRTENVEVINDGSDEFIRITVMDGGPYMQLQLDTNNMEFYQGMYDPPITKDVSSFTDYIDDFDTMSIRQNGNIGKMLMESVGPDTVERDIKDIEVFLGRDPDMLSYVPETDEYADSDEMKKVIGDLKMLDPLLNEETKEKLIQSLELGSIGRETKLQLLDIIYNNKRMFTSFSYLAIPPYLEQVQRLTNREVVSIPQEKMLLFTDENPPKWLAQFNKEFPEKNTLTDDEYDKIQSYLDLPEFITLSNEWNDDLHAREILLTLFEDQEITQEDIVSFYLVPFDRINPSKRSVLSTIEYGEKIREQLKTIDEKYGTDLFNLVIKWERRKIFRKENH